MSPMLAAFAAWFLFGALFGWVGTIAYGFWREEQDVRFEPRRKPFVNLNEEPTRIVVHLLNPDAGDSRFFDQEARHQ